MSPLAHLKFDIVKCRAELKEFGKLLNKHKELAEQKQILPFFKKRKHLGALIGSFHTGATNFDRFETEHALFGDFRCDLISGDSQSKSYCIVEFEDAKKNSIFTGTTRRTSFWAKRMEVGFGQIIDWFYMLDDMKNTSKFRDDFGDSDADFLPLLIIGRSRFIKDSDKKRLRWRNMHVSVGSTKVQCMTYDELYKALCTRLSTLSDDENNTFKPLTE